MFQPPGIVGSFGLLLLRVSFGGMLLWGHGLPKLMKFNELREQIGDPLELIPKPHAFTALVGAEFVCAALVILGLLTRVAALPVVYAMGIAAFVVHKADPTFLGQGVTAAKEPALVYMLAFAVLFFTGPGLFSLDAFLFGGRKEPEV